MPDIALCLNEKCPSRQNCWRYTAIPYEYCQSYAEFELEGEKCSSFIDNKGKRNRKDLSIDN